MKKETVRCVRMRIRIDARLVIRGERLTKEELKQIYYINKEIKMWQRELDAIECKSLIKGQVLTGMPYGSGTSDPTFNIVAEREKKRKNTKKLLRVNLQRYRYKDGR